MKKRRNRLFILVALMLLITVGGTYAAWTYATNPALNNHIKNNGINITESNITERGVISTRGKTFNINFNDVDYNHKISLNEREVLVTGGDLYIKFTPNPGTNINLLAKSYYVNIKINSTLMHNDTPVIVSEAMRIALPNKGTYFEGKINSKDVYKLISGINLELPTALEHASFKEELTSSKFEIVITDDASQAE